MRSSMKLPMWYRALALVVGVISIALAFVVLIFPGLAILTLVFLLAFALLVVGVDRLIAGVSGHPFGWMPGTGAALVAEMTMPGQNPPTGPPSKP